MQLGQHLLKEVKGEEEIDMLTNWDDRMAPLPSDSDND